MSSEKIDYVREDLSDKGNRFDKKRFIGEKKIDQTREDLCAKKIDLTKESRLSKRRFI